MTLPGLPPRHPPQSKPPGAYVHRLELSSRCSGQSAASRSAMDLSNVLSDRSALQQLVGDLFRPFEALRVDQVLALHVEGAGNEDATAETGTHRFSAAIAGAIAGAKELGTLGF
jgi:hypothetical protein